MKQAIFHHKNYYYYYHRHHHRKAKNSIFPAFFLLSFLIHTIYHTCNKFLFFLEASKEDEDEGKQEEKKMK